MLGGMRAVRLVGVVLASAPWLLVGLGHGAREDGFARFQVILDRQPFGAVPVPTAPTEVPDAGEPEVVDEGPPLQETLSLSMLTRFAGLPAAGITDSETGRSFYLFEGESLDEYTLLAADIVRGVVTLRKGHREVELTLPSVSSAAAAQTQTAAAASDRPVRGAQSAATPPPRAVTPPTRQRRDAADETLSYRELQRQRYEEARRRREEETARIVEQATQRGDQDRMEHLRRIELERIRQGAEPLVPITLTPEEVQQLAEEGWDVSGAPSVDEDASETP